VKRPIEHQSRLQQRSQSESERNDIAGREVSAELKRMREPRRESPTCRTDLDRHQLHSPKFQHSTALRQAFQRAYFQLPDRLIALYEKTMNYSLARVTRNISSRVVSPGTQFQAVLEHCPHPESGRFLFDVRRLRAQGQPVERLGEFQQFEKPVRPR